MEILSESPTNDMECFCVFEGSLAELEGFDEPDLLYIPRTEKREEFVKGLVYELGLADSDLKVQYLHPRDGKKRITIKDDRSMLAMMRCHGNKCVYHIFVMKKDVSGSKSSPSDHSR